MASIIKGQIKSRSNWVIGGLALLGIIILYQVFTLQTSNPDKIAKGEEQFIRVQRIKAARGNIYASDGKSLLATSLPIYRLGLDPQQASNTIMEESLDSLCIELSRFFKNKSKQSYKEMILAARKAGRQYVSLNRRFITHEEKKEIEKFPILREGRHEGGLILTRSENRFRPFGSLGRRTIGGLDPKTQRKGFYGVEASFNEYLAGKDGKGVFERLNGGYWMPLESSDELKATAGQDVITTIDVNFQDIVESALRKQVISTSAKYGSAIVMEIETGEVKAIANLSRRKSKGKTIYLEDENHAVLGLTDPGSTFKLATMLALLEEGNLRPDQFAVDCKGILKHNKKANFTCSHEHGILTVQEVFEQSCNIGVYELVRKVFGFKNFGEYREYLSDFRLDKAVGFQLKGEIAPYIKTEDDETYSNTTFPWTSIGYECSISPLQMLAFYNGVANGGYWIQPLLVKEVREIDEVTQTFTANKIDSRFASKSSIQMAQNMLKGVAERGTAKGIREGYCSVAGKTGTAQKRKNGAYQKGKYYTSFIGFFPADNPKYSCLVVVDEPTGSKTYGGSVCAPVFREIADKVFSYDINVHPSHIAPNTPLSLVSEQNGGYVTDLLALAEELDLETPEWKDSEVLLVKDHKNWVALKEEDELPDVIGLVLRDALPILENKGYTVRYSGRGKVESMEQTRNGYLSLVLK